MTEDEHLAWLDAITGAGTVPAVDAVIARLKAEPESGDRQGLLSTALRQRAGLEALGGHLTDVPLPIDADLRNADWTKRTFDFPAFTDMPSFVSWLHGQGTTLAHFKTLPAYTLARDAGNLPDWWKD